MRPETPHLAPLPPNAWTTEQKDLLAPMVRGEGLGRGVINVFATLVRYPKLFKRWGVFAGHVLFKSTLSPRDREILILRIAYLTGSAYEWGQHVSIGRDAGLSQDEIEAIKSDPGAHGWSATDRLLLQATDQLHANTCIAPETWAALAAHYSEQQMLDLIFTVGNYNMLAMALNSIGVELDEDYKSY